MDAVQPEWSICASIFGTAGLDVAVCQAALVFADLYVHARGNALPRKETETSARTNKATAY